MHEIIKKEHGDEQIVKLKKLIMQLDELNLKTLGEENFISVINNYALTRLTSELGNEIKKAKIDVNALRETWLKTLNSETTAKNYRHNVDEFFGWSNEKSPIEIDSIDADNYFIYLKSKKYGDGTIRFKIACISSFFGFLVRHDVLVHNYFDRIKLPKKKIEVKNSEDVPTEEELNCIQDELIAGLTVKKGRGSMGKIKASKMLLAAIYIMKETACRVGALSTICFDHHGYYSAKSKGNNTRGAVSKDVIKMISELGFDESVPFKDFKTGTIKKYFQIVCKRLYQQGKIRKIFSPHSIRHFAAVKHWNEHRDIYLLKKFLNHKSISTSQVYLASLNMEV